MEAQEIKSKISISDLAVKLGVKFKQPNNNGLAHCFNRGAHKNGDINPSLQFFDETFKCHGGNCGVGGDHFTLIELVENYSRSDFPKTKGRLIELAGLTPISPYLNKRPPNEIKKTNHLTLNPAPPSEYLKVCQILWSIIQPLNLTLEANSWLKFRGIMPGVAHKLGCRDIRPVSKNIKNLVKDLPFFRNKKGLLWYPILESQNPIGLMIPEFHPDYPFPLGYRCRLYKPWKNNGNLIKVLMQPRHSYNFGFPLGLYNPKLLNLSPKVIFFTEGEPDYLSIFQIWSQLLQANYKLPKINVIGLSGITGKWNSNLNRHIFNSQKYVICTHDTQAGKDISASITTNIISLRGLKECRNSVVRQLFSEKNDANDLLLSGKLESWILNIFNTLGA